MSCKAASCGDSGPIVQDVTAADRPPGVRRSRDMIDQWFPRVGARSDPRRRSSKKPPEQRPLRPCPQLVTAPSHPARTGPVAAIRLRTQVEVGRQLWQYRAGGGGRGPQAECHQQHRSQGGQAAAGRGGRFGYGWSSCPNRTVSRRLQWKSRLRCGTRIGSASIRSASTFTTPSAERSSLPRTTTAHEVRATRR